MLDGFHAGSAREVKLTAPHYAIGPLMHALHDAEVDSVLALRTGPGWVVEFMTPISSDTLTTITRLGATIIHE